MSDSLRHVLKEKGMDVTLRGGQHWEHLDEEG